MKTIINFTKTYYLPIIFSAIVAIAVVIAIHQIAIGNYSPTAFGK